MGLKDCVVIALPKIADPRGNLSFVENQKHIPFSVERVFFLYDVPSGAERGGHALRFCEQFLISISGSFDVVFDDGRDRKTISLNRPHMGLYLPPMIWRELKNFSTNSVCLALASRKYDERDYFRDYDSYLAEVKKSQ